MTKTEALSIIKQACVEANPSIMDLKFGCRVSMIENTSLHRTIEGAIIFFTRPNEGGRLKSWYVKPDNKTKLEDFGEVNGGYTNSVEILGRTITLADVLFAIETNTRKKKNLFSFELVFPAQFRIFYDTINWTDWVLNKPLHEQSEATLVFIAGLLKK